jgi:hypothetical protein
MRARRLRSPTSRIRWSTTNDDDAEADRDDGNEWIVPVP